MFMKFGAIALAAGVTMVATVEPSTARVQRMISIDETRGNGPLFHDNGINDGRVCRIFFKRTWDRWTEDFVVRKVKRCRQF